MENRQPSGLAWVVVTSTPPWQFLQNAPQSLRGGLGLVSSDIVAGPASVTDTGPVCLRGGGTEKVCRQLPAGHFVHHQVEGTKILRASTAVRESHSGLA